MNILLVSSECTPYAKTGGLGDAVAGLSKALRRLGHDARIVIPLYASIDRERYGLQFEASSCVHLRWEEDHWIGLYQARLEDEVPVWFIDFEQFFNRPGLYHDAGGEYSDNANRFGLFSKAALQICLDREFTPEIVHVHDWPTALATYCLRTPEIEHSPLSQTASVLTIHNIGYQGTYSASALHYLGISGEHFTSDIFEDYGRINLLKSGIHFADALTTVSPTHARELLTPLGGHGLAPYLNQRSNDLFGILNGADYELWNPDTDVMLPARYRTGNMRGKAKCKATLQAEFGLEQRADVPLFGIVSRFVAQKGFDLVQAALPQALNEMNFQVAVLGSGEPATEEFFRQMTARYPGRVGNYIGFSERVSHLIEGGSDFFLMPSIYEPCGLNQIYSLKYGTLPLVRATGGLDDTVQNYDEMTGNGTGFKFYDATPDALRGTMAWAISTWYDRPQHIQKLRRQAMKQSFTWENSARGYLEVYEHALRNRRGHQTPI